jgi:TolB-like protein/tetratricopeptide (TPR) repeat protein
MAQKPGNVEQFLNELRRRKTIRVITVYAATAFIILQVVDLIAEPLRLPEWTMTFLIVLLIVGFAISALLSWIYDITPAGVKKTDSPGSELQERVQTRTDKPGIWKKVSYISILIIVALLAFNIIKRDDYNDFANLDKSVAVLPFINDSPSDTNGYFINGIMQEILNHLQAVGELRVISRTSVEQYRNTTKSIPEIAREQGVNYIVEGSGQKYGNSFNISVQLIRASKEDHLWSRSYEQEISGPGDIIEVQSQIAQSIVSELKATITPEVKHLIEKVHTTNLTAYDFYQRGREELLKYRIDNDNMTALDAAGKLFRKSLEFDPSFADAYAGQAQVYWYKNFWSELLSENYLDSVLILANLALSYDDQLAEAYYAKGAYFTFKGLKNRAIEEFDKAIELNPNDWLAYYGKAKIYDVEDPIKCLDNLQNAASINQSDIVSPTIFRILGGKLLVTGFIDKAKFYFTKAFKLDGDSAFYFSCLGGTESDQGNYKKAVEYFGKAYRNRENYTEVIRRLGENYLYDGNYSESLKYFREYLSLVDDESPQVAYSFWQNGFKKEAEKYFNERQEWCRSILETDRPYLQLFWAYYELACIYSFRGDKENAIRYLKMYAQNTNCELYMLTHVKDDPLFDPIRNEPEFRQILREMETNYQALHEKVGKWLEGNTYYNTY